MNLKFSKYNSRNVSYVFSTYDDSTNTFSSTFTKKELGKITVNNIMYSIGTIIIGNILEDDPEFEKIKKIYLINNEIFFEYVPV